MRYTKPAFTLIELMIVVAIIGFLASIAIPSYTNYLAKAKQAEVAMNLASLHAAQQAYWAEHGRYNAQLAGEGGLNWRPAGFSNNGEHSFNYTYGFNTPGSQEGAHFFVGKLKTSKDELKNTLANNERFIAAAAAKLHSGKQADIWVIDENRNIKHLQDGTS
jgi:prepilin-type N-terminal cleavage/methylation domain-containing protein